MFYSLKRKVFLCIYTGCGTLLCIPADRKAARQDSCQTVVRADMHHGRQKSLSSSNTLEILCRDACALAQVTLHTCLSMFQADKLQCLFQRCMCLTSLRNCCNDVCNNQPSQVRHIFKITAIENDRSRQVFTCDDYV